MLHSKTKQARTASDIQHTYDIVQIELWNETFFTSLDELAADLFKKVRGTKKTHHHALPHIKIIPPKDIKGFQNMSKYADASVWVPY